MVYTSITRTGRHVVWLFVTGLGIPEGSRTAAAARYSN